MEKLATDIYSFDQLRNNGFTYVDKTAQILPLVDMSIGKQFFLARRDAYVEKLLRLSGNGNVKVVTGIRRCGKSYLLDKLLKRRLAAVEEELE